MQCPDQSTTQYNPACNKSEHSSSHEITKLFCWRAWHFKEVTPRFCCQAWHFQEIRWAETWSDWWASHCSGGHILILQTDVVLSWCYFSDAMRSRRANGPTATTTLDPFGQAAARAHVGRARRACAAPSARAWPLGLIAV